MANRNAPRGLVPVRNVSGRRYEAAVREYYVPATDATALFIGDPVIKATGANTAVVSSGTVVHAIGTLMTVTKATLGDGNKITGVIVGFEANPDQRSLTYRKASTESVVLVCDDPSALFEIQADGVVGVASVGLNAVLTAGSGGSSTTGLSSVQLDSGTTTAPATTATFQLNIVGISREAGCNDPSSANVRLLVRINNHTEVNGAAGIA